MATSPLGPGDISLRDFIEAIGAADGAHGAVSTAAVAGGLGSSLLLMVAALPQTKSGSLSERAKLAEATSALTGLRQQLIETIETETAVKLFTAHNSTCSHFIQSVRLDHAARLLHRRGLLNTNQPINEIAYSSGFVDYSHFARRFRRRFGRAPGAFS